MKDPAQDFRYVKANAMLCKFIPDDHFNIKGKNDFENPALISYAQELHRQDRRVMNENVTIGSELHFADNFYSVLKTAFTAPDGKKYVLGCVTDITERRKTEAELKKNLLQHASQLAKERISNTCLQIMNVNSDFNDAVQQSLARIGELFKVDHCFIYCRREAFSEIDHNYTWTREGIVFDEKLWGSYDFSDCPDLWSLLNSTGFCCINDFTHHPNILRSLQGHALGNFDQKALLIHTLSDRDGFYGFIGMSTVLSGKKFSVDDNEAVKNCGQLFLLARERAIQNMQFKQERTLNEMVSANFEIPVVLFDAAGKIVKINHAGYSKLGIDNADILKLPCYETICKSPFIPVECPVRKVMETGKAAECDLVREERDYHVVAKPIFNESGELQYILESGMDVTEVNHGRKKLMRAIEEAQAGELAKNNFISTMNHELRTPLNAVIGFAELLMMGSLNEVEQREYIENIHKSGEILLKLLNDILYISQVDTGTLKLNAAKVNLVPLLSELETVLRPQAEEKYLSFKVVYPALLPELYIDAARLRQIMLNLLGNAIKFTRLGGVVCTLQFAPDGGGTHGRLKISVEDTGIGISEDTLPHVFEAFKQDEHVRESRAYQGSGLGLAIAKRLLDTMGGDIAVKSCENIGSTFTISFEHVEYYFPQEVFTVPSSRARRLLIVDDLPMNLKLLEAMLAKTGCECVSASSGKAALSLLEEEHFDLVLTDIMMPDMDGVELAQKIRLRRADSETKIFAITADHGFETPQTGLFDRIFMKPVSVSDLSTILNENATGDARNE